MRVYVRWVSVVLPAIIIASWSTSIYGQDLQTSDEFLDKLVGSWQLTGSMGSVALRQRVDARWVIQGNYLQVHVVQDNPISGGERPYEAIYMFGFDRESGRYVMHLFDTFGAGYSRTIGTGVLRGNSVEFLFDYPTGQFSNTLTWEETSGRWKMILREQEDNGNWSTFATKILTRT